MTLERWIVFCAAVFFASIIPGPSMLLALSHGMKYGPRRTVITALGNLTATFIQAGLSIIGLGAAISVCRPAYMAVKWGGIIYLFYLGVKLWMSKSDFTAAQIETRQEGKFSKSEKLSGLFTQAFCVTMGNPKAILFFTALFPQFIDIQSGIWAGFALILTTLLAIAFGCFMLYAYFGALMLGLLDRLGILKFFNRITGGIFMGTAAALAMDRD